MSVLFSPIFWHHDQFEVNVKRFTSDNVEYYLNQILAPYFQKEWMSLFSPNLHTINNLVLRIFGCVSFVRVHGLGHCHQHGN